MATQDPRVLAQQTSTQAPMSTASAGSSQSNTQGSSNQTTVNNSTTTANRNTSQQNMTPESLAALELLIRQLMGGGTQQMAQDQANRINETNRTRQQQAAYSKNAAFADAQGAMSQQLRRTMEELLPSLTRAAEGAGSSANSMRALMLQDVATRAAESSSALGLNAAVNYGGIAANFANTLEALTRPNTQVSDALINALNIAKGAVSNTQENSTSNTTGTQNTVGFTNQTQNNNAQETRIAQPLRAPSSTPAPAAPTTIYSVLPTITGSERSGGSMAQTASGLSQAQLLNTLLNTTGNYSTLGRF